MNTGRKSQKEIACPHYVQKKEKVSTVYLGGTPEVQHGGLTTHTQAMKVYILKCWCKGSLQVLLVIIAYMRFK